MTRAGVTGTQNGAPNLFGLGLIKPNTLVKDLMLVPAIQNGGGDWLDSCCQQVADSAMYTAPVVKAVTLRAAGVDTEYTPVVTSSRRVFIENKTEFEVSFYNLSDPRGIPVVSRMVSIQQLFYKSLDDVKQQKIAGLIDELEARKKSRLPLLGPRGEARFVVHRSMMEIGRASCRERV